MSERDSRRTGILRLRHLKEVNEAKGEEMVAQQERFARLADPASAPRVVTAFNLFQTPEPLAERLAGMFDRFGRTLEPSAGLGRLYQTVRVRSGECPITLVDSSPACCGELYRVTSTDPAVRLVQGDFLTMGVGRLGLFDSIIMNPPFRLGADIKHIRHALELLAPGGQLVAICAAGIKRRIALEDATEWIDLPDGSFKSEGTAVGTAVVVFRK